MALLYDFAKWKPGEGDFPRGSNRHTVNTERTENPARVSQTQHQARDAALVKRIQHDDVEAFAALARAYMVTLTNVAYAVLGSNAFADDVVQEVFVSLWERRSTLQVQENIAGYLVRAVRHRALNLLRHERVERRVSGETAVLWHEQQVANDAEQRLQHADDKAQLDRALAHVPERPRQVLLLSLSGLSYPEIAEALGLTVPSVRTLMYRATQRLAQHLAPREDEAKG